MIKTNKTNWILVADGGQAMILTHFGHSFKVIHHKKSPFQQTPSRDLASDKDGNFYAGRHHSKGNSKNLHQQAEASFIVELSALLAKEFCAGMFNELSIIMPPKALGVMRHHLNNKIRVVIRQEVAKDLSYLPEHELKTRLEKILA